MSKVNHVARDKIVLSVSIERVINATIRVLEQNLIEGVGNVELSEINHDDWLALKSTVVTLWEAERQAAWHRKLAGEG